MTAIAGTWYLYSNICLLCCLSLDKTPAFLLCDILHASAVYPATVPSDHLSVRPSVCHTLHCVKTAQRMQLVLRTESALSQCYIVTMGLIHSTIRLILRNFNPNSGLCQLSLHTVTIAGCWWHWTPNSFTATCTEMTILQQFHRLSQSIVMQRRFWNDVKQCLMTVEQLLVPTDDLLNKYITQF